MSFIPVYNTSIGPAAFMKLSVCFQMPEEQAFCVLVKIMFDYGLRALYRNNFEDLHCKFYQLERLMQVHNLSPPPVFAIYQGSIILSPQVMWASPPHRDQIRPDRLNVLIVRLLILSANY